MWLMRSWTLMEVRRIVRRVVIKPNLTQQQTKGTKLYTALMTWCNLQQNRCVASRKNTAPMRFCIQEKARTHRAIPIILRMILAPVTIMLS
jgi:hypothetical protein